jgi:hypothetical protein
MPLRIKPNPNENEEDFVSRCMSNSQMNEEFPDKEKRSAVCYSLFKEKTETFKSEAKRINFLFHPKDYESKGHAIEKADDSGVKRKYLCGISSGLNTDKHGERMSEKCIKSFMQQASTGDVLLYTDVHGIRASEDIGILTKAEILPNGDWYTEYRLYDELDNIGPQKSETIDYVWRQMLGLPPYKKPKQKGFSIEGIIPENAVSIKNGEIDRSVIEDILLDGVVLVPRPAYGTSIAIAICKAFGETSPERKTTIINYLRENIEQNEISNKFHQLKWDYQNALEEVIEKIMRRGQNNKQEELDLVFNEYKDLMISLILQSEKLFLDEEDESILESSIITESSEGSTLNLYKTLRNELVRLYKHYYITTGESK